MTAAEVAMRRCVTRSTLGIGVRWAWRIAYAVARLEHKQGR